MNATPCTTSPVVIIDTSDYQPARITSIAPGHLQALARLHGLKTTPLATARVLELHADSGTTLLTYAIAHPSARVLSVARPETRVAENSTKHAVVHAQNLEHHTAALSEVTANLGEFDYILSTAPIDQVAPEVQQQLFRIFAENLGPLGIAYICHKTESVKPNFSPLLENHRLAYVSCNPRHTGPLTTLNADVGANAAAACSADDAYRPSLEAAQSGTPTRVTLIYRDALTRRATNKIDAKALTDMHFGMWVSPIEQTIDSPSAHEHYQSSSGQTLISNGPVTTQVIETLRHVWPASVPFSHLIARVRKYMPRRGGEALISALKSSLLFLMESGLLKYHFEPPGYVEVSRSANKPRLLPAAVRELQIHHENSTHLMGVLNLWHEQVALPNDPITRTIAPYLDGTTTIPKLRSLVRQALSHGDIPMPNGFPTAGRINLNGQALQLLMPALQRLRQRGLIL